MQHVQYSDSQLKGLDVFLKNLLHSISENFRTQSRVIKDVWINNTRLDSDSIDELGDVVVSQFFSIRVESEASESVVLATLDSLCGSVQSIKNQVQGIELDFIAQDEASMAHNFDFMLSGLQDFTEALTLIRKKLLDEGYLKEPKLWFKVEDQYRMAVRTVYEHFFKAEWSEVLVALRTQLVFSLDLWLGQFDEIKNCLEFENSLSKI